MSYSNALFNRVISISFFAILLFIAQPVGLLAQQNGFEPDTLTAELEPITIVQNRLEIPFSQAARDVDVLERAEVQKQPVQSLAGALSYVPGVDIRQRGPIGVQADLSIRGGTFDESLVLLNGIKLSDPQTGHHSMNVPVNMNNIKQVQVLKGPGARIYGQNAFTGAVNLITRVPDDKHLSISGYGGDFTSYGGTAALAMPGKRYSQYLSVSRDASDGYRYNTDYSIDNIFYQSELNALGGSFNVMGGYTAREFGANGFYASPQYKDQWESVKTSLASVEYQYTGNRVELKPRVYWRHNRDRYLLIRDNPSAYENIHKTDVIGTELNGKYDFSWGTAGFGLEYRNEQINSNNLGNHQRDNIGVFAEQELQLSDRLRVTPGLYLNWYSDYDWNIFPGIDLSYAATSKLKLFGNVGKSYRVPTYTDLYYNGPTNVGNPDLQPEEAVTYEGGARYVLKGMMAELSGFYRDGQEMIDWVRDSQDDPWKPQNFYNVDAKGIEASLELIPARMFGEDIFITRIKAGYEYIDKELKNGGGVNSRYALDNLNHQLILGVQHRIIGGLSNNLKVRYIDRATLDNYWLLDARLNYQYKRLNLYLEASNLTDTRYTETNLVPMPGRWIRGGVRYEFEL